MILLPLRVEDAEVDRLPWVSIGVAGVCALMFAITFLAPGDPSSGFERGLQDVDEYWHAHPYLEYPPRIVQLLSRTGLQRYEQERARGLKQAPSPSQVEEEQDRLDTMVDALFHKMDKSLLRRLSLVPSRGLFQLGLLTHMFLHGGWLHLLGNLFYFYLTGLLLEDRWGRGVFAGFYLLGGLVAGTAHYLLEPASPAPMMGASGAIAACMGAFSMRFAVRKIRMAYLFFFGFRVFRGTFLIPAWFWGLFWFGGELFSFGTDDGSSGVAFMAHIGGFAFGAVSALGLKWSGIEAAYIAPAVEKKTVAYQRPESLDRADDALAREDLPAARHELEAFLRTAPDHSEAQLQLLKLDLREQLPSAGRRAEKLFAGLLPKGTDAVWPVVEELSKVMDPGILRPATAFRIATALDAAPEGLKPIAERYFAAAGKESGPFGAKALLRAAEARLDSRGEAKGALEYLEAFRAQPNVPPDLLERAEALQQRAQHEVDRDREIQPRFQPEPEPGGAVDAGTSPDLDWAPPPAPALTAPARAGEVQIMDCQVSAMSREALALQLADGRTANLPLVKLLAVAAGVAPERTEKAAPKNVLYTDLVTSWGSAAAPATVLRLKSSTLRLHDLYPGMPPQEAYGLFLAFLLDQSGAAGLPSVDALKRGEYPRYPDVPALNRALYG